MAVLDQSDQPRLGYAAVLRVTGARQFLFGSAIERLGGAMFGVAVVAMVSARTGSYSLAGAVSAGALAVLAITAAIIGRLVDRYGQRRVTLPLVVWSTLWSVAVVAVSITGAPAWTLFVTYAMSAVVGTTGTLSRARWSHLLGDQPGMLHTAMSLEQVIDELAFVGGPAIAVVLATTVLPEAGYIAAAFFFAVGALVFLARTDTEPPVDHVTHKSTRSVLRIPGVLVVCAVSFMIGGIFGANEIVTIATAAELGHKGASGLILALYALASALAGVVYGAREDAVPAHRALWIGALAMCVLEAPVLLVDSIPLLAVGLTLAGMATAPTLIVTMKLAGSLVPGNQVTESMGMVFTAMIIGIAAGSSLGGIVVQSAGGHAGYVVPVVAAGLGAALGFVFNRRLR
ncbi:MFS transporter [Allobranchiibius sp. GilTou38]|uniref:MFS transporter n=1 Tax=Allobranchiibius sp. GilTou38 TaxID=2815210 RepID=UPI001AA10079|nr:MFS transporter [Allobranchiibius sp. GilTou38]MBO1765405.1 MFS transporter [Allobranchiibius sp. GilTou38]